MQNTTVLTVTESGMRLDRYVSERLPELSRAAAQRLIDAKNIFVDGVVRKASYKAQAGETITVRVPPPEPATPRAEKISLETLRVYEDDDLIVINKPAGMVVHPAPGHSEGTLVNALLGYMQTAPKGEGWGGVGGVERPGIVHRLDSETSGVIVVAKNDAALRDLQAQFKARRVHKTYLALVDGSVKPPRGKIDAPIGRDPRHRQKMAVIPLPSDKAQGKQSGARSAARDAVTVYRSLANLGAYTLVQAEPQTGRTHQVRVHLTFLGFPVVADAVYGKKKNTLGLTRQFLHAWKIEFTLPRSGRAVSFVAPLPEDLVGAMEYLGFSISDL